MTMTRLLSSVAYLGFFAAGSVQAQQGEEPFDLGTVVIEAARTGAGKDAIPGTVQVVEGDAIQRRIASGQSLSGALSDIVPGLAPANGTIGGASQTLRGRTTQILIDGVARTSELRGFDRELSLIDPSSIERIEIIKGSTARFGNGATGGIINIVTKTAGEGTRTTLDTRFSFQDGDDDSFSNELFLSHERRMGDLGLRFELSRSDSGQFYDGDGSRLPPDPLVGQGNGDNTDRYTLGFAADWARGPHELEFRFDSYQLEQEIDVFTDYSTNPVSVTNRSYTGKPVEDRGTSANLTYRHTDTPLGELEVTAFVTDIERRAAFVEAGPNNTLYYSDGPGTTVQDPAAQTELFTTTYGLSITMRSPFDWVTPDATLTWGLDLGRDEVEQELLDGTDVLAPMSQNSVAVFAQAEVPVGDRWQISAGLRAEQFSLTVSDFTRPDAVSLRAVGGTFVPLALPALDVDGGEFDYSAVVGNIGTVYSATPNLDFYGGFSQGFSIPDVGSFTRRAVSAVPTAANQTISIDSIRPEAQIVNTWEVGTRYQTDTLSLDASAFLSTSDEGTIFDSATNTLTQQKERIWGAELSADYQFRTNWSAGAQVAYTEGRFDDDGDDDIDSWLPINRIPSTYTATLYTDRAFNNGLTLSGEVVYASGRDKPGEPVLGDTVRVNVGGSYALGNGTLNFGVSNLFDQDQINPTASSVRTDPLTDDAVRVADQGRRIAVGYSVSF
ncbi:TonB-dependent receptor [Actibacterium sp. 188UL27-1]|uniref:TonB-dependent receptor n=1 Tax=Actibacterium sp. 188UL27-1 TaxID=2786961 RepID=UPI00195EA2AF|nr:TonB-dependent receptor [Actibacterium sp. 188UL27-1]MBM7069735.1 TonB-dependent receptor [Actibacterium sp. 188UL27-1]